MVLPFILGSATGDAVGTAASILVQLIVFGLPLILVAFSGMSSERSGIINLGLEGLMVLGAFAGFLVLMAFTPIDANGVRDFNGECLIPSQLAVLLAIVASVLVGAGFSFLLSYAAIKLKANQVIIGTAINIMASALVVLMAWIIQGAGNTAINTPVWVRITATNFGFSPYALPINGATGWDYFLFFLNKLVFEDFFLTTPIIVLVLVAVWFFYFKTKTGLRIRACGENPQAADSVGINVAKTRYLGTTIGGALAGLGGFSLCLIIGYDATVIGFGFLALAVMIFGNWYPGRIVLAGLLFAFCRVISNVNGILPSLPLVNYQYIYYCIPYVVTILVLIFTSKTSHAPKAEGIPYDKGGR